MKKNILIMLISIFLLLVISGCSSTNEIVTPDGESALQTNDPAVVNAEAGKEKLKIVTSMFVEYDWVREILGENIDNTELIMLLDNGADIHSYQPTVEDIANISTCDIFIYVGGESDTWVDDALQQTMNPDMKVINLLDSLGDSVKTEELVEGMQESEHDEHEHDEDEHDEHVWLSLRNAQVLCKVIVEKLAESDSENAEEYRANAVAYDAKLAELDIKYQTVVNNSTNKTVLFGDRFPFRYLVDDYGIGYYAAFAGCSAETEASFETVIFLSGKVDELGLSTVLTIEKSDQGIAQTIVENTQSKDQKILVMNSIQSITSGDAANGMTYLRLMEDNLSVLEEALR